MFKVPDVTYIRPCGVVFALFYNRLGREEMSSACTCCMKNDAGNVVSDADGMKNIWRKYMEKLLNVENGWIVDCPEVMGPHCLISEEEVAAVIKGLNIEKAAGPTGMVSEMMKAAGSKRHSLQAVELSQRTQAAVQMVSNLPAPINGGPIYRFLGHAGHADPLDGWRCCSQNRVMSRPIQVRQL